MRRAVTTIWTSALCSFSFSFSSDGMKPSFVPFFLILSFFSATSARVPPCSPSSNYSDTLNHISFVLINASSFSLYSLANSTSVYNVNSSISDGDLWSIRGMFQCRGDVSLQDCHDCVNTTMPQIMQDMCLKWGTESFIVQADLCNIRFWIRALHYDSDTLYVCNTEQNTAEGDILLALQHVTLLAPLIPNYYATSQNGLVSAMALCDTSISSPQCHLCLKNNLVDFTIKCASGSSDGRMYFTSCFYQYTSSLTVSISMSAGTIAGLTIAAITLLALILCLLLFYSRRQKLGTRQRACRALKPFLNTAVIFSYEELQTATRDFHPNNKLGQGGFGPVYKGTLADGREVAIKKLSTNSHQGEHEFINEVSLITSVQHKNLINLYGCCVQGSERLLVYEYLPNKSLDLLLFKNEHARVLNWRPRFDMVLGIAGGLAYLHKESQVRIIHRDIKPGNILLDHHLMPKIADFGLARLFSQHISHITTRVAGTVGYLSPEYAMHGQLTEKVDVYSFGMVTLEIVSGRRNIDFTQPKEKQVLLFWAWNCYNKGDQWMLLDPRLSSITVPPVAEVFRVIHVALLCVQSSPTERPSMSKVIQLLSDQIQTLERPNMPPYLVTATNNHNDSSTIMDNEQLEGCTRLLNQDGHQNLLSHSEVVSEVVGR